MIIVAIIALAGVVLAVLFGILSSVPEFINPATLLNVIGYISPYLNAGIRFFNTWTYPSVVQAMLSITVALEGVVVAYKIAMWVATKIPMFGVSD